MSNDVKDKTIQTAWVKGAKTDAEKHKIKEEVYSSLPVLEKLYKIVEQKATAASKNTKDDYDIASWAYYAADNKGYTRALNELLTLIKLEGMNV